MNHLPDVSGSRIVRAPVEATDAELQKFYQQLTVLLRDAALRNGDWTLLECLPAWQGNWTWDCFIVCVWQKDGARRLVAVNYAGNQSQCYVRLPLPDLANRNWRLKDAMSAAVFDREGNELLSRGLYLDLPPWGYQVFAMTAL